MYEIIRQAIESLLSVCDGARTEDGSGFNKIDGGFARSLASQEHWSIKQAICAHKMLKKYRGQLSGHGIDYESIPVPEAPAPEVVQATLDLVAFLAGIIWTEGREVNTRNGKMIVESAHMPNDFWTYWNAFKPQMKEQGISCSKYQGAWQLSRWSAPTSTTPTTPDAPTEEIIPADIILNHENLLLDFQIAHVKQMIASIKNHSSALDSSDTGTGKTYSSLAVCKELGLYPIVITPKSVIHSFKEVMADHFGLEGFVTNYENLKTGKTPYLNVSGKGKSFKCQWIVPENAFLIFDEAHRCKRYDTQNAKMLIQAKKQNLKVMAMSATIADNPMQMFAVGYMLELFSSTKEFFGWVMKHGCSKGKYAWEFNGSASCLQRINSAIYPKHGSRISIANLGDAFPETLIRADAYEMNGNAREIQRIYDEMSVSLSELRERSEDDSELHLVTMLRARQKVELLKVPTFVEMAKDHIEEGNSVAIFVNFNETAKVIADKLETKNIIWGSNKAGERDEIICKFQSNETNVVICNIRAGGVGISLHDLSGEHRRVSIISPSWSAQDLKQALGRVHRAGGSFTLQKIVYADGTIENDICDKVRIKIDNISLLNDGDTADVWKG